MYLFYQTIVTFIILISPLIIIYRIFNNKEDKIRFIEKFGISSIKRKKGKVIWLHGASVGEILSVIPIIKNFEKNRNINQILFTSSTLSSSKILKNYRFKKTIHQFYPIDHFFLTSKFINYWKPDLAIFVESEIWPCMFKNINSKNIPLILLNARITKKTYAKWIRLGNFSKSIFNKITAAYPQNLETNFFLKKLMSTNKKINILGNLKFIEHKLAKKEKNNKIFFNKFNKKKIWVASSTHVKEEVFCAEAHIELRKRVKNLVTIIIPRHVHRANEIIEKLSNLNLKTVLHSTNPKNLNKVDVYVVDTFGETNKFHKIAPTVFLGGSIIKRGGQNPLEAARHGSKILHGPNVDNFKDVYKLLKSLRISKKINSPKNLANLIVFKKNKISGQKIRKIGEKILKKTIKELETFTNNEFKKT